MKSLRSFSFRNVVVLALAMIAIFSVAASAESTVVGKFTLTQETHWGKAVLAPGAYTFTMTAAATGFPASVTVRQADGKLAGVFLSHGIPLADGGKDMIELQHVGKAAFVKSLSLKDAGMILRYATPGMETIVSAANAKSPAVIASK